ncbi:hypothetical protein JW935_20700, partial [candidate division KSB1 bacterium]|nr:hypothetical protein [candidate division KSB1 bacterium]
MKTNIYVFFSGILAILLSLGASGCYAQPGFRYSEDYESNDNWQDQDSWESEYEYDDYDYEDEKTEPVNVYNFYTIQAPGYTHVWWYDPHYQLNYFGWTRLHRRWGWNWTVRVNCRHFNVFWTWAPPVYYTDPYVYVVYSHPRPFYRPHFYSGWHRSYAQRWAYHYYDFYHQKWHKPRPAYFYAHHPTRKVDVKRREYQRRYPVQNLADRRRRSQNETRRIASDERNNHRMKNQDQQRTYTTGRKTTNNRENTNTYQRNHRDENRRPSNTYATRQNNRTDSQKKPATHTNKRSVERQTRTPVVRVNKNKPISHENKSSGRRQNERKTKVQRQTKTAEKTVDAEKKYTSSNDRRKSSGVVKKTRSTTRPSTTVRSGSSRTASKKAVNRSNSKATKNS